MITNNAMQVRLSLSQWSARKYDKKISIEVALQHDIKSDQGRYHKVLIALDWIKKIGKQANAIRMYHQIKTLPWKDEGIRILPVSLYFEYTNAMRTMISEYKDMVKSFLDVYPSLIEQAKIDLNRMFNEADYPSIDKIARKYDASIDITPIPSGNDFRVNMQESEKLVIQQEIERKVTASINDAMKDVWNRLYTAIKHMSDKLNIPDSIFRDSLVENIQELCELLPKMNLTNDQNLNDMIHDVTTKLYDVNANELRENPVIRKETAAIADDLLNTMQVFV